jgi:hypothetical protein
MAVCGHKDVGGCASNCVCSRAVQDALFCLECGRGKIAFNNFGIPICKWCGSHHIELGDPVEDLPAIMDYRDMVDRRRGHLP